MAEVIWTPDAFDDLLGLEMHIARYSRQYSVATSDRIQDAVQMLSEFPEMGRLIPGFHSRNIRQLIVRNYVVVYRLIGGAGRAAQPF